MAGPFGSAVLLSLRLLSSVYYLVLFSTCALLLFQSYEVPTALPGVRVHQRTLNYVFTRTDGLLLP